MTAPYTAGTIDLVSGSSAVVGTDTAWEVSLIIGGTIYVEFDGGNPMPIATVDSDTEITAALKWTGPTGTYSYAIVRDTAYGQQTVTNAQALATYIQRLNNPALAATAGVTPGSNKLLLFTGANSATVIDLEDLLQGVKFNEEVPTLADRATYDGEAEGFRVLVANIGDGRSAFYTKKSAAVGDWTVPFYITGPMGGAGPYTDITIGPTETLPAGSDAEVTLVPVSPGVIRLDFGLPKGEDGSGTGDVVGPAGGVSINDLAVFADTTGKLLKKAPNNVVGNALLSQLTAPAIKGRLTTGTGNVEDLTPAQASQLLGGWEPIGGVIDLAGKTAVNFIGLSPFCMLWLVTFFRSNATAASISVLRTSTNNGSSFDVGASDYGYSRIGAEGNAIGAADTISSTFIAVTNDQVSPSNWVNTNTFMYGLNVAAPMTCVSESAFQHQGGAYRYEKNFGFRSASVARNAISFQTDQAWQVGQARLFGIRG